ncbi:MAG TPA: hypothetical protein VNI35_07800 [Nitrospira sp.]|nr:hypothetical protein [Nitrospira sp.]
MIRTLVCAIAIATVAGSLWTWLELRRHRSPTVVTEVGSFEDVLDPALSVTHVKIRRLAKESTGLFDAQDIRSSRVELAGGIRDTFSLPLKVDLAAQSSQVLDLDGNGIKEILLYQDEFVVGVVWLRKGKLNFRPDRDLLKSWAFDIRPKPTDDGHLVFVAASEFPEGNLNAVPRPRLFSWNEQEGFRDVTSSYPTYVNKHLIPVVREALRSERNEDRKANFAKVLAELSPRK